MKVITNFLKYSSLHVAFISGIHMLAFFNLPSGTAITHWPTLLQVFISTWIIYIVDRLLDNIYNESSSPRHAYFENNQYNFSLLLIGLIIIDVVLCFFQKAEILIFGFFLGLIIVGYLFVLNKFKKVRSYKEFLMPILFVTAITGPGLILSSSINLSSWILTFMYLLLIYQNIFAFSYLEALNHEKENNFTTIFDLNRIRKWINYLGAFNIILFGILFLNFSTYPDKLAFIITLISFLYTLGLVFQHKIKTHFREVFDGLLFLFILVFFI